MKKLLTLLAMLAMVTFNSCTTDDDLTGSDDSSTEGSTDGSDDSSTEGSDDNSTEGSDDDLTGSDDATLRTLTFEDADYVAGENYLGEQSWSSLIDSDQAYGSFLYGDEYKWTDSNNTELHSEIAGYDWGYGSGFSYAFYNGGIAVSNYYCEVAESVGSDKQLSIPVVDNSGNSGNGGSENFAVVYAPTTLSFSDGEARVIDHMYVTNTSYALVSATIDDGDGYGPLVGDEEFWVSVTGYDADGESVGELTLTLATTSNHISKWTKWDLSSLGAVASIYINVDSDNKSNGYSNIASYVAIDDIAVQF